MSAKYQMNANQIFVSTRVKVLGAELVSALSVKLTLPFIIKHCHHCYNVYNL